MQVFLCLHNVIEFDKSMPVRRAAVLVVKLILEGLRDLNRSKIFKFIESNRILCFHEKCPKVYSMIPCLYILQSQVRYLLDDLLINA